jgi:uncharacterized protein (TIGR00369 family)
MGIKDWAPSTLERVREFIAEQIPFNRFLGMEVTELSEGFCRLEIPFRQELVGDPFRPALHGGVISTLIDTCGGAAVFTLIEPADRASTIDLRVDYLRPGALKRLACEAKVTRLGNYVASVDMKVFHLEAQDTLIATGKGVYSVKRFKAPE